MLFKNKTLSTVKIALQIDFLERTAFFAMRSVSITTLISVFEANIDSAAITNGIISTIGHLLGMMGYITAIKFGERKVLLFSSIILPFTHLMVLLSLYCKSIYIFLLGLGFVFGLGSMVQSTIISTLQNLIPSIARKNKKLSEVIITNIYVIADIGIVLAISISPKLPLTLVSIICFAATTLSLLLLIHKRKAIPTKKDLYRITHIHNKQNAEENPNRWKSVKAVFAISILTSPFYAVINQGWTSWYFQGKCLKHSLPFGLTLDPVQLMISGPILYAIFLKLINNLTRKYNIPLSIQVGIGTFSIFLASVIVFETQNLIIYRQINIHILYQIIPHAFAIFGDCILLLSTLEFIHRYTNGVGRILSISASYIKLALGAIISMSTAAIFNGDIYLWMSMSVLLCAFAIPFTLNIIRSVEQEGILSK